MKAIIPVAGEGTRLRPHTHILPKALLNVAGKPILSHIVDTALEAGVDDIAFIVGYKGEKIEKYVAENYSHIKTNIYYQEVINGIAGAVKLAEDYLTDEPVFIVLGDTIFETDLKAAFNSEYSSLGVKIVEDPRRFGTAEVDGDGFITKLVEKPQNPVTKLALAGLYYIKNGINLKIAIDRLFELGKTTKNEYQITDALQIMIENGEKTKTFNLNGWFDCGKVDALLDTNRILLEGNVSNVEFKNSIVKENVHIGKNVQLIDSVIGSYTSISDNCVITNSVIEDSIIGHGTKINNTVLKSAVIGNNSVVNNRPISLNICDESEINNL